MGLRRLWINLTVEAAIKRGFAFPLFSYLGSRASANPRFLVQWHIIGIQSLRSFLRYFANNRAFSLMFPHCSLFFSKNSCLSFSREHFFKVCQVVDSEAFSTIIVQFLSCAYSVLKHCQCQLLKVNVEVMLCVRKWNP
jgi:hypothetical protein